MTDRVSAPTVAATKRRLGAAPLVMVTAYDTPMARIVDDAGVDIILVGDSVANVVLGHEDTLAVTMEEMVHHVAAVARARPRALVVGDLPWMSYHLSVHEAVANAARLVRAGAGAVKLEGGLRRQAVVEAVVAAEIPVMGHLGLTPQSVHAMGGYRVQGRSPDAARSLLEAASVLEEAGCFALVLEGVPDVVAAAITEALEIPTIGIGAGPSCDGQVLVSYDLLGIGPPPPKFVRRYAQLGQDATAAVAAFCADVRAGRFPTDAETYHAPSDLEEAVAPPRAPDRRSSPPS